MSRLPNSRETEDSDAAAIAAAGSAEGDSFALNQMKGLVAEAEGNVGRSVDIAGNLKVFYDRMSLDILRDDPNGYEIRFLIEHAYATALHAKRDFKNTPIIALEAKNLFDGYILPSLESVRSGGAAAAAVSSASAEAISSVRRLGDYATKFTPVTPASSGDKAGKAEIPDVVPDAAQVKMPAPNTAMPKGSYGERTVDLITRYMGLAVILGDNHRNWSNPAKDMNEAYVVYKNALDLVERLLGDKERFGDGELCYQMFLAHSGLLYAASSDQNKRAAKQRTDSFIKNVIAALEAQEGGATASGKTASGKEEEGNEDNNSIENSEQFALASLGLGILLFDQTRATELRLPVDLTTVGVNDKQNPLEDNVNVLRRALSACNKAIDILSSNEGANPAKLAKACVQKSITYGNLMKVLSEQRRRCANADDKARIATEIAELREQWVEALTLGLSINPNNPRVLAQKRDLLRDMLNDGSDINDDKRARLLADFIKTSETAFEISGDQDIPAVLALVEGLLAENPRDTVRIDKLIGLLNGQKAAEEGGEVEFVLPDTMAHDSNLAAIQAITRYLAEKEMSVESPPLPESVRGLINVLEGILGSRVARFLNREEPVLATDAAAPAFGNNLTQGRSTAASFFAGLLRGSGLSGAAAAAAEIKPASTGLQAGLDKFEKIPVGAFDAVNIYPREKMNFFSPDGRATDWLYLYILVRFVVRFFDGMSPSNKLVTLKGYCLNALERNMYESLVVRALPGLELDTLVNACFPDLPLPNTQHEFDMESPVFKDGGLAGMLDFDSDAASGKVYSSGKGYSIRGSIDDCEPLTFHRFAERSLKYPDKGWCANKLYRQVVSLQEYMAKDEGAKRFMVDMHQLLLGKKAPSSKGASFFKLYALLYIVRYHTTAFVDTVNLRNLDEILTKMKAVYNNQKKQGHHFCIEDLDVYSKDVYSTYGEPKDGDSLHKVGPVSSSSTGALVSGASAFSAPRFSGAAPGGLGGGTAGPSGPGR